MRRYFRFVKNIRQISVKSATWGALLTLRRQTAGGAFAPQVGGGRLVKTPELARLWIGRSPSRRGPGRREGAGLARLGASERSGLCGGPPSRRGREMGVGIGSGADAGGRAVPGSVRLEHAAWTDRPLGLGQIRPPDRPDRRPGRQSVQLDPFGGGARPEDRRPGLGAPAGHGRCGRNPRLRAAEENCWRARSRCRCSASPGQRWC